MSPELRLRGLAGVALALLSASCANFTGEAERVQQERVARAILPMARVSAAAGQTATAERLYQRLLEADPESVGARMGLGDLAIDRKSPAEAMRWYEEALERAEGAEHSRALLAHGRAALAAGRIDAARESLTRFIASEPPPPDAQMAWGLNGLALIAIFEEDPSEAVLLFEQAAVLAPDQARIKENLDRARAVLASRPPAPEAPPPPPAAAPPPDTADAASDATTATQPETAPLAAPEDPGPETSAPAPAEPETPPPAAGDAASPPGDPEAPAATATAAAQPETAPPAAPEEPEPERSVPAPAEPEAAPPAAGAAEAAGSGTTPPAAGTKVPEKASDREIAALMRDTGVFLVREGADWFLQVAAFVKPERAERLAGRTRGRSGFPVRVVPVERGAQPLYLVRAGPVRSRRQLRALLDALDPAGDG